MPTIQSKKYPDRIQFITVEAWQIFMDTGRAKNFKVIDDGDLQDTVIATPHSFEVTNVQDLADKLMTRDEIKDELDKLEVEYNTRASTDKLYQLYIDNQ